MESWAGCIAGALEEDTYRSLLQVAGFVDIEIEVTRRYSLDDIASSGARASVASLSSKERNAVDGRFISAFVRARKLKKEERMVNPYGDINRTGVGSVSYAT
jgi:hypothetical protein